MSYLLRYHSKQGNITYLTTANTFSNSFNKDTRNFQTLDDLKNYWLNLNKETKTKILTNHDEFCFDITDNQGRIINHLKGVISVIDKEDAPAVMPTTAMSVADMSAQLIEPDQQPSVKPQVPSLQDVFTDLKENQDHCLILDLEFYSNCANETKMAQIGGLVLGTGASFNKFVFDPDDMSIKRQLDFLKNHNVTYQDAVKLSPDTIMTDVQHFIRDQAIDTLVSWGNNLDFTVLKNESYSKIIPSNLKTYDLEGIFAHANNTNDLSLNLKNFSNILNLPHTGKWHDALDDVKAIYRICQLYMNVLVPVNEAKQKAEDDDLLLKYPDD